MVWNTYNTEEEQEQEQKQTQNNTKQNPLKTSPSPCLDEELEAINDSFERERESVFQKNKLANGLSNVALKRYTSMCMCDIHITYIKLRKIIN